MEANERCLLIAFEKAAFADELLAFVGNTKLIKSSRSEKRFEVRV